MGRWRLDHGQIEVVDDRVAAILRTKQPWERVAMIGQANRTARALVEAGVRWQHPDWADDRVRRNVARIMLPGLTGLAKWVMEIDDQLEELFDGWRTRLGPDAPTFVRDGVIGTNAAYARAPKRLLFVLKEPHDRNGILTECAYDLRTLFRTPEQFRGHRKTVERTIARWSCDLWQRTAGDRPLPERPMNAVAVMNLKKTAGGATSDDKTIHEAVARDQWFICKQFRLLDPEIIVTAGTFRFLRTIQPDWKPQGNDGIVYRRGDQTLIDHHHPSAWATVQRRHREVLASIETLRAELTSSRPSETPSPTSPSATPTG